MSTPILATKLNIPPPRPQGVVRPRLLEQLNDAHPSGCKLTLVCAPAGFGKTTLVSEWATRFGGLVAWLSLDEGDRDPVRFLTYFVAALQTIATNLGEGVLRALNAPQSPPTEVLLTVLLTELVTLPDDFVVVLDDYHVVDAPAIDDALTVLLEHLPPRMHLVLTTREDPRLPLARFRARGQLSELRATDLRFTSSEAAEFLTGVMGLNLLAEDVALLEARTEGWIAGLQLAALSLRGQQDASSFIQSFSGSHRFVVDYLLEEVLQRQPEHVQTFLLCTSILEQLSGSLCDAILQDPGIPGQTTLEQLERANLFVVPLDDDRRWYRYHHLFAELLRQRLQQKTESRMPPGEKGLSVNKLHVRASRWYEVEGFDVQAFHHAVAAQDIERAARLAEGEKTPLLFRGAAAPVLNWLESLPAAVLNAKPSLWMMYATSVFFDGQISSVEPKLQAAEAALQGAEPDDAAQDLRGRIASMRATLAIITHDVTTIIAQSRRSLELLHPDNLPVRAAATYTLGYAHQLQGDRAAASQAYTEILARSFSDPMYTIAATLSLGQVQETNNQLSLALASYEHVLQLAGEPPWSIACEAQLGLARIFYAWNDLQAAHQHGQQCLQLTQQMESVDTFVSYEVFLAQLKLAHGDVSGAAAVLAEAGAFAKQHNFVFRLPDVAAAQVLTLLRQGQLDVAAQLAQRYDLPLSQARVHLARGDTATALAVLAAWRQEVEAKGWLDEILRVGVLQAVAYRAQGNRNEATRALGGALALAEPEGLIRVFMDEGGTAEQLLIQAAAQGMTSDYLGALLTNFRAGNQGADKSRQFPNSPAPSLFEPLSPRELEVLALIAQGFTNREISKRLFRALDTVKGHNRIIFDKLQVGSRTEAVARARELGLL